MQIHIENSIPVDIGPGSSSKTGLFFWLNLTFKFWDSEHKYCRWKKMGKKDNSWCQQGRRRQVGKGWLLCHAWIQAHWLKEKERRALRQLIGRLVHCKAEEKKFPTFVARSSRNWNNQNILNFILPELSRINPAMYKTVMNKSMYKITMYTSSHLQNKIHLSLLS